MNPVKYTASFAAGRLTGPDFDEACVFGQAGLIAAAAKREGDGASPVGVWPVRRMLYRADRLSRPVTALESGAIAADDGWCDAPQDPAYNRPVRRPYPASHEELSREDGLYDLLVVLGHNDDPPVKGLGSAIFLHCWRNGQTPTRGCLALAPDAVAALVRRLKPGDLIEISA